MSILSYVAVVILAPILIKFLDRAYVSAKETEMFKDLADIDTEPTKK